MEAISVIPSSGRQVSMAARLTTLPLMVIGLTPVLGWWLGGGIWYWLGLMVFGVAAVLDPLVGPDRVNHDPAREEALAQGLFYRVMLWLLIPLQYAVTLFSFWLFTSGTLSGVEMIGFALTVALGTGFLATAAHELCHHPERFDQFMGMLLFLPINMANFWIYHNYGHHNLVATPDDPASAKFGENLGPCMVRSIGKKFWLAWRVEAQGLARRGYHWLNWRNRMIWITALQLAWDIGVIVVFGPLAAVLLFAQWFFPRTLLAAADYVEHYGLGRRRLADGSYEKIRPEHAWDDSFLISSLFFCQIDRHSDHHYSPSRPYQILRVMDDAPRLPYGYLTMLFVAMVPSLWHRWMDPITLDYYRTGRVVPNALPGQLPAEFADADDQTVGRDAAAA